MLITSTPGPMDQLIPVAVAALIKATVLLSLVGIAAYLLRRRSAALRHLLWTLAIAGIVALPVLSAVSPFQWHLRLAPPPEVTDGGSAPSASPSISVHDPDVNALAQDSPSMDLAAETNAGTAERRPWSVILLTLWLAGVLLSLARFAAGLIIVRRLALRATPVTDERWLSLADRAARTLHVRAPVNMRVSADVAMPFAKGLITPTIVLPTSSAEWTAERREAVLMHEFAHISRGDLAMNTLSHVARAVYWFHPLAWLAAYRLRVEGERACDDAVLNAGARPSDYAEHLLSIVRSVGPTVPSAALAMARRSDFEGRLLAILEPGLPRGVLTRWRAAGMAALFLFAVMPLAAMSPAGTGPSSVSYSVESQEAPTETPARVESAAAVSALMETLSDANAAVRMAAINSLGQLQDPRAIAALAKAMRDDTDPRVREAAAWALGEIDDVRAVPHLLEALKAERVASVREKIVRALGEIDDPSAVGGITGVLKDQNVAVRRAAVWALGELEDPAAVASLALMVRDEDTEVRKHVAEALSSLDNASGLEALLTLAKDANAEVRMHAISGLGDLEDLRALGTLVAALKDANADVRQHAAEAIGDLEGVENAPRALIEALADGNKDVRQSAVHALGHIGDAAAVPGLKKLTADGDTEVRRGAAEALSEIGGPEAISALMGMLKDPDPEVRRIVAEALGTKRR